MKIVFVTNAKKVSGAEEHLLDLASGLKQQGIIPYFLVRKDGLFEARLRQNGHICFPVFTPNRLSDPYAISKALRSIQPDVISVNREHNIYITVLGCLLSLPLLNNRPKLVNVFHTPSPRRYPFLNTIFDGILATSQYTASAFHDLNPAISQKLKVIHYGVALPDIDPSKQNPDRPRKFFKDRLFPIIGMVGELWKNQQELISVGSKLKEKFPSITIAIVGGGDEQSKLEEMVKEQGLSDTIVFTGRIARKDVYDVFYDLDLSVSTHRNEGFGIVHIESLARFTPVVAYRSGGIIEILEYGGGVLVKGGSNDFCESIGLLLTDKILYNSCASAGRENVEQNFSIQRMLTEHIKYYNNIISK